jgi:microcystin-dependent protein
MATALRYPKGHQFRDGNDYPVSAGRLLYERAGTTIPLATYSDAGGVNPNTTSGGYIVLDAAGRLTEAVYIGSDYDAKETLFRSGLSTVPPWPDDYIPRPVTFTPVDLGSAPPLTKVITVNQSMSPYTLSIADAGALAVLSTASGDVVVNLPPAASFTNGQGYWFSKPVANYKVTIAPNGSDKIRGLSSYSASIAYQSWAIVSDGAAWVLLFDSDGSVGDFKWFLTSTCPEGRLVADGSAVSRTVYAALFGHLGTAFGAGDGSTTFNLPDARGEFIRGYDGGRGIDSGRAFGSFQADNFKLHGHPMALSNTGTSNPAEDTIGGLMMRNANIVTPAAYTGSPSSAQGQQIGGSGGSETRPRNIALLPTIKF